MMAHGFCSLPTEAKTLPSAFGVTTFIHLSQNMKAAPSTYFQTTVAVWTVGTSLYGNKTSTNLLVKKTAKEGLRLRGRTLSKRFQNTFCNAVPLPLAIGMQVQCTL